MFVIKILINYLYDITVTSLRLTNRIVQKYDSIDSDLRVIKFYIMHMKLSCHFQAQTVV